MGTDRCSRWICCRQSDPSISLDQAFACGPKILWPVVISNVLTFDAIFNHIKAALEPQPDDAVSVDVDTLLAATDKLLAINRGVAEPDDRDSMEFRRVMTPDKLLEERIELDAGKLRRVMMRRLAKVRSLKPIGVSHFDPYSEGLIVGHPLSAPIEEVNPIALVEQSRRLTAMGPGGVPSDDSITEEMQNVNPSQFGFISVLEGPESQRAGVDVRLAHGVRFGSDGKLYQKMMDRRAGHPRWVSPSELSNKTLGIED